MAMEHEQEQNRVWQDVPDVLRQRPQWVVWRLVPRGGALTKRLYNPRTGAPAKANDPRTWATFAEACTSAEQSGYAGIGYVFSAEDPYTGVDLDGCRNMTTGAVAGWAQAIIDRLDSYTEVSPSGTGVHILVHGALPPGRRRSGHIEMYDTGRYFTVTGAHLAGTPATVEERQAELAVFHAEVFADTGAAQPAGQMAARRVVRPPEPPPGQIAGLASGDRVSPIPQTARSIPQTPVTLTDGEVLALACAAANGQKVCDLYDGHWEAYYESQSQADAGLCRLLAFYTQDPEQLDQLFRASALCRAWKWDRALVDRVRGCASTYGAVTIARAIDALTEAYQPTKSRRAETITFSYPWQLRAEAAGEREALLRQVSAQLQTQASDHFSQEQNAVLVLASPPGVGKSHALAELGVPPPAGAWDHNLAWIAERKNMREQVPALQHYHAIQACSPENCPDHRLHELLLAAGRNTWPIHKAHACPYSAQFRQDQSTIYQLPHVQTAYPTRHAGIVIDELNLANWLQERELTRAHVLKEATHPATSRPGRQLLQAVLAVLHATEREQVVLYGRALFDALHAASEGQLAEWVGLLADDPRATDPYPTADLDPEAPDVHHLAADLPPVTLGHLWPVLAREVPHWQRGEGWNSLLRVGLATDGREQRALYVSQPRSFTVSLGGRMPPRVILDATANESILRRLLRARVHIEREDVTPPPHLRHVAVRTGKHYGITAMKTLDYRERAIKEVRHLLRDLDPEGALRAAGQVGLITFKAIEAQVARALGIPPERSGHFWGIRGSNAFSDCALLLVLGTPMLNPEELFRMGCALYAGARRPLVPDRVPGRDKKFRFVDRRLQELSDVLTQAELTQCAHRNRPLRFDGRTVVTFCDVAIDFLPETQRVIAFPERLAEDGRTQQEADADTDAQRLERAVGELVTRGERPTVARMEGLLRRDGQSGIRTAVVGQFLRAWRGRGGPGTLGGPCAA